jgi:hypothetical protein
MGFDKLSPNALKTARPELFEGHHLGLQQAAIGINTFSLTLIPQSQHYRTLQGKKKDYIPLAMNEKVYIHIGLHKTATTHLQKKIFPGITNLTLLSRPYTQLNHAFNKLQYADESRYCKEDLLYELEKFKGGKLLISDEMLSGQPFFNYINRSMVAHRLKAVFPNSKIILFLRNQGDILYSLYNTWIKNLKGTEKMDQFIWFPSRDYHFEDYQKSSSWDLSAFYFYNDNFSINLSNFNYYELVHLYKNLFEDVHVFLYEDYEENPHVVLSKLEDIIGEKIINDTRTLASQARINSSLTNSSLEARRLRNTLEKSDLVNNHRGLNGFEAFTQKIIKLLGLDTPCSKDRLMDRLNDFYLENNRMLMATYPEIGIDRYPDKYQVEMNCKQQELKNALAVS